MSPSKREREEYSLSLEYTYSILSFLRFFVFMQNSHICIVFLYENLGWYASVVVDGQGYRVMGSPFITNMTEASQTEANQTAVEFTPTRTSLLFTAGPMQINATFLSPIEVCLFFSCSLKVANQMTVYITIICHSMSFIAYRPRPPVTSVFIFLHDRNKHRREGAQSTHVLGYHRRYVCLIISTSL